VKLGSLDPIGIVPKPNGVIQITVPDDQYPADFDHATPRPIPASDQLQPGPQLVQVLVERSGEGVQGGLDRGTTFTETVEQSSEQSVFILAPAVATISLAAGILTVTGKRLFQSELKSYVYVRDVGIEVGFKAGDPFLPPTPTQVQVPLTALIPPLPSGTYPVRIQVNGALNLEENTLTLP